jgi:hypothetical protein
MFYRTKRSISMQTMVLWVFLAFIAWRGTSLSEDAGLVPAWRMALPNCSAE